MNSPVCLKPSIWEHTNLLAFDLKFTELVERSFFVDDFIGDASSLAEGIELFKKLKPKFIEGRSLLRKWRTNNFELYEKLSKH